MHSGDPTETALSGPTPPPTWRVWKAGRRWWQYPLAVDWVFKWSNHALHRWAPLEFLEYAGRFTVLVAVIFWLWECDDRTKERHYRAWELVNAARGSTGDGGRRDALQDLNRDGVSLAAAPLEQAYLPEVGLEGARLTSANLKGAHLYGANLKGADLYRANLTGANLCRANLQGANLYWANLQGANLQQANLEGAFLLTANLEGANFEQANLKGARLFWANLEDAVFMTQEQLDAAEGDDKTVLPDGLTRPAHWSKSEGGK